MNIINIGGWYVGNTAILDWMDGFEELAFVKGDFNITRSEAGVMDIIAEKNPSKKIVMIRQQKQECFKGIYRVSRSLIGRYTKHLFKPSIQPSYAGHFKFHRTFFSFLSEFENKIKKSETFDEIKFWKEWLSTLPALDSAHKNYTHTVYQNPFFYDETFDGHKSIWPELFSPYKMIFVHRDPLDQFADIVKSGGHLNVSWPRFHGETEEMHPADRFLTIAKKLYTARLRMAKDYSKDELVIFSFEDFLYEHERVTGALKTFLDIKSQRDPKNKRFFREQSIQNIGKGQFSVEVKNLLKDKHYVMDELNELRQQLIVHPNAI